MTQRTPIYLSSDEDRRSRRRAADLGISLAEYVRRLVRRDLDGSEPGGRVEALFGLGHSGSPDISSLKGEYIADAIGSHQAKA